VSFFVPFYGGYMIFIETINNIKTKMLTKKIAGENMLISHVRNPTKISRKVIFFEGGFILLNINPKNNVDKILTDLIKITFENKLYINSIFGNIVYISNYTSDEVDNNNYSKFIDFTDLIPKDIKLQIRYIIGKTMIKAQRIGKKNEMVYTPQINDLFGLIVLLNDINYGQYREIKEN
jgi:hypothetical protein